MINKKFTIYITTDMLEEGISFPEGTRIESFTCTGETRAEGSITLNEYCSEIEKIKNIEE